MYEIIKYTQVVRRHAAHWFYFKKFLIMAFHFVKADEQFIEELKQGSENNNTKQSTNYWTSIFQQWAKTRGENKELKAKKYHG